jgi:cellulose synthase/poly-beta-1,6-N-acetylglucosamine synthase-like glycosyltransferase
MSFLMFWLSLAMVVYVYIGFPLLVVLIGKLRNRQVHRQSITPTVSFVIAAYNEAQNIAERLDNVLSQEYPSDALEIIVASDGSNDATASIVASYASRGVRLLDLPRRGKIHALNDAVTHANGEILVFSDANIIFERQTLRLLVRNFADPEVGGVTGNRIYTIDSGSDSSSRGERLYWSYDKWLKQLESLTGSIVSGDGAIHAIRRELYQPLTASAVTDDFAISTAVIEQGRRLVFESEACAYEVAIPAAEREFWRKVRLMTRGLRGLILRKRLLNPFRYGFYALSLLSHKLLRRFVPVFLILMFFFSILASADNRFYVGVVLAQTCFYGLACVGYLGRRTNIGQKKYFYIPFFYCLANIAALFSIIKLIRGDHIELWNPQRHNIKA